MSIEQTTTESLRIIAKRKRAEARKVIEEVKEDKRKNLPHGFKKGVSGNPNGRPKGSRNKLTILKEAVLASAENIVLDNFEDIVKSTVALAKKGDPTCLKIVWDRIIPAKRAIEDKGKTEDKLNISINIEGMERPKVNIEHEPIEADFEEIKK